MDLPTASQRGLLPSKSFPLEQTFDTRSECGILTMMLMNEVLTNVLALAGVCGRGLGESWDQNLILAIDPLPPSPTTYFMCGDES